MSTCNQLQLVDVIELGCNLVTEQPASTTGRNSPGLNILRITPDQITEGTLMRNFLSTGNDTDLINGANLRTQTTMNTENLAINDSSKDEEVEDLAARLPDRGIAVLLLTLFVETVDLGDLAGLVVSTDESDLVRVPVDT